MAAYGPAVLRHSIRIDTFGFKAINFGASEIRPGPACRRSGRARSALGLGGINRLASPDPRTAQEERRRERAAAEHKRTVARIFSSGQPRLTTGLAPP